MHTRMEGWLKTESILKKLIKDKLCYICYNNNSSLTKDIIVTKFFVLPQHTFKWKSRVYYIKISKPGKTSISIIEIVKTIGFVNLKVGRLIDKFSVYLRIM